MPESAELSALPASSPLHRLRATSIDIAKRLDALIAHIEDTKGSAEVTLIFRRGEWLKQRIVREFDVGQ